MTPKCWMSESMATRPVVNVFSKQAATLLSKRGIMILPNSGDKSPGG